MKLDKISFLNFNGKIIDAHAHYGRWDNGKNFQMDSLNKFLESPLDIFIDGKKDTDSVEKILISSMDCINSNNTVDEVTGLKQAIDFSKQNKKLSVLAVCQPNLTQGNAESLKTAIENNPNSIIGLKFHPQQLCKTADGQTIAANHQWYNQYMQLAKDKKLPCLFHSDGTEVSNVAKIYELAKKYKDVPVILGHCGGSGDFNKALEVLKSSVKNNDAKLYCDISWLNWENGLPDGKHENVKTLISELKANNALDRILFGTDAPLGCFGEKLEGNLSEKQAYEKTVSGLKTMIKKNFGNEADDIINKIFYQNAQELFFDKNWAQAIAPKTTKTFSKTKIGFLLGAGILAVGAVSYLLNNKKVPDTNSQIAKSAINNSVFSNFTKIA